MTGLSKRGGWRSLLLVTAVAALAIAGCGGSDESASGGETSQNGGTARPSGTIEVLTFADFQRAWEDFARRFESKYPDVKVETTFVPVQNYGQVLRTRLASGNAPDLFYTTVGEGTPFATQPLAREGLLLDVSGQEWESDVPAEIKTRLQVDGKPGLYGVPMTYTPFGVAYNVELFEELGVEVPTTWSELLDICAKAKQAGHIPIAYYFGDPLGSTNLYNNALAVTTVYAEDPDWNQKRANGDATFAGTDGWREALQKAVELNKQCFQPRAEGTLPAQAFGLFTSGKAIMVPTAASSFGGIAAANPKLQMKGFPLPASDDASQNRISVQPGAMAASARTDNKDATLALGNYLADNAVAYANALGTIAPGQESGFPEMLTAFEPFYQEDRLVYSPPYDWQNPEVLTTLGTSGQGLITGQKTIDDVLADLDAAYDQGGG